MDSKKILTIGAGAVVGYLIFCKFMKRAGAKSLEEGAPSEEGMGGGGGGGGFSPVPILPVTTPPAVIINNPPAYTPQSGVPTYNAGQFTNVPQNPSGAPVPTTTASTTTSRDTTPSASTTLTTSSAVASRPSVISPRKFTDFDGNQNFQDALL